MTTVLNGLVGGLVAGGVAAVAAELVFDGPRDWTRVALELGYGAAAGGVLLALELFVLGVLGVPPATREALGVALGWSVALFVALAGLERVVRGRGLDRPFVAGLAAYHLVYGLCLGVWIRVTWIT